MTDAIPSPIDRRVAAIDWAAAEAALDRQGFARLGRLLDAAECRDLFSSYQDPALWRSTVVMKRHGFGEGEYKYFADPLPDLVGTLRRLLYARLAPTASKWRLSLGGSGEFPPDHDAYRACCAAAGQTRPTPLVLSYGPGDYNRLHQDLYGAEVFPIQVAILLSRPDKDFEGGEFVLTEQKPRSQSRAHVVPQAAGEAVAFAVADRPALGTKGVYRAKMRHGVSTIRRGLRRVLGVIFHDAAS